MKFLLILFLIIASAILPAHASSSELSLPTLVFTDEMFTIDLKVNEPLNEQVNLADYRLEVAGVDYTFTRQSNAGLLTAELSLTAQGSKTISLLKDDILIESQTLRVIPDWLSIVPPVIAILFALVFKDVLLSLFISIITGVWIIYGFGIEGLVRAPLISFEVYLKNELANAEHVSVIMFTMMTGGMISILAHNGGMQGVVKLILKVTNSAKKGMVMTSMLGTSIFFDDYANALLVGKTMRPVTDKLRISREKLAFLVDSTAAPVACIAFLTTWVGNEISLIDTAIQGSEILEESAASILLNSIPYSFYPILILVFIYTLSFTERDFGPMYKAEMLARKQGVVSGAENNNTADIDIVARASNFFIPILVMISTLLTGLYITGEGSSLIDIIGSSDPYAALMWASFLGALTAAILSFLRTALSTAQILDYWVLGLKNTLVSMLILLLAWGLSAITKDLHTAQFLSELVGKSFPYALLPALVFFLAVVTAFASGSSWGTMGIMIPITLPLVFGVMEANQLPIAEYGFLLYSSIGSILAGAVCGDHCSPISDTTVLSAMSSDCDHIKHISTQLPYALVVAAIALFTCLIPVGYGVPLLVVLPIGVLSTIMIIKTLGKKVQ